MQQRGQIPAAEKSRSRGKQEKAAAAEEAPAHSRATRLERLGDRAFITSRYDKAMKFYERASSRVDGHDMPEWLRLELKMARVYNMLQDPENSAKHYTTVYESSDSLLDVDDACTYIDALRLLDRTQQAEGVARHYAFRSPHSRNQRFLNTLYALSNQQHYYNKGEADYAVRLLAGSTGLLILRLLEESGTDASSARPARAACSTRARSSSTARSISPSAATAS